MKQPFNPKVSIVIPVYNGSNYLKEAIDSALSQTYDNIEVIVVNDGSNDNGKTDKICKSYGDKIRYFVKENGGVATALNKGIEEMKGEYFSWLSHDDVYFPNKIEKQVKVLSNIENKQTILYSSCTIIDGNGEITGSTNHSKEYSLENLNSAYFPLFKGLVNGCSMLIHQDNFKEIGLFDSKLPTTQDYQLWFDMFKVFPVKFVNKDLIKSRIHNQQGSVVNENHIKEADELWIRMIKGVTANDVSPFAINLNIFYEDVAKHLELSPLRNAYNYVKGLVDSNKDLVSIILPVYNRDYCITKAMNSVYTQSYKNYELIIVDDGSIDNTAREVKKNKNDKTVYIKQENGGVSKARNTGIKNAKGAYIAFIDSDDSWTSNHLELHMDVLKKDDEYMMSFNDFRIEGPMAKKAKHVFHSAFYPRILFISYNSITTPSVVLKTKILKDIGIFDESMDMCEDLDLWRRIAKTCRIKEIKQILTTIVLRENQFTPDDYLEKRYIFIKKAYDDDQALGKDTLLSLLIELWTVYFSSGASIEAICKNLKQVLVDYKFLEEYMRKKAVKGKLYIQLYEDSDSFDSKTDSIDQEGILKKKGRRFLELVLSQGLRTTLRKGLKKYTKIFFKKIKKRWSNLRRKK